MRDRTPSVSTFRLVFVPSLLTLGVSGLRLAREIAGDVTRASGGAGAWLGITWLALVFGAWFGIRLAAAGDRPRLRPAALWLGLATLALLGTVAAVFREIVPLPRDARALELLEQGAPWIVTIALALLTFAIVVWRRLAWTLLVYALIARLTVLLWTWWAKSAGWDTHYTKFGPHGFEFEMAETMRRATLAQLGFWVPFTVVVGGFVGALAACTVRRRRN